MNHILRYALVVILFCIALNISTTLVRAAKDDRFTLHITPAFQEIVLGETDTSKTISVDVRNLSSQAVSLQVSVIDIDQKDSAGRIQFLPDKHDAENFIKVASPSIELAPGEKKTITAEVINETTLSPGGHYAALLLQPRTGEKQGTGGVIGSVAAQLFIRKKAQQWADIAITGVNWPKYPFTFSLPKQIAIEFENKGNIHLVPYGRVDMVDMFGRTVRKGYLNESSLRIFPGKSREIPVQIDAIAWSLPIGYYTMNIEGGDSLRVVKRYEYNKGFFYINPIFMVVTFFFLFVLFQLYKRYGGFKQIISVIRKK